MKSDDEVTFSFEYGYNWNVNIVSVTDKNGNTTHYDKENRLASVKYPSGSTMKYKYDKKDNLLEKKRVVDGEVVSEGRTDEGPCPI